MTISDDIQVISWMAATIAALVTANLAIINFRNSIKERHLDLRWKMANSAAVFVREMHSNQHSSDAVCILDWLHINKEPPNDAGTRGEHISLAQLIGIMHAPGDRVFNERERDVLECFDWFFYYIDRMEQNIRDGLFSFDSVKYIFLPYYEKVAANRAVFDEFALSRRYLLAPRFWKRFDNDQFWKT
jgi:hypothetical protein